MMRKLLAFSFFFGIITPSLMIANGSPINTGEIRSTGNIQMIQKKDIRLLSEILSVQISGDYAHVRVHYRLQNLGAADKVTYGFPIEKDPEYEEEDDPDRADKEEALADFKIMVKNGGFPSGRELPILETRIEKEREYAPFYQWNIIEIPFAEKEELDVIVTYRVKGSLSDYVYTKSFRPKFSSRTFRYSLKPAANWGDGFVQNCLVEIDTGEFAKYDSVVASISPAGYSVEHGVIKWSFENLDLAAAEDIVLVYDNSAAAFTRYVNEERLPLEQIADKRASSVLKTDEVNRYTYGPTNLFDGDLNTAWVEGVLGYGTGEWVEIEFVPVTALFAIGIVNGYTKSESLYQANNRISKIRLDIVYEIKPWDSTSPETLEIDLEEKQFNELNRGAEAPFISWLADFGDGQRIKKIRLTILEVTPGEKYYDTCIAELFILGTKYPW